VDTNYRKLGNVFKKYRKLKDYSTQEFANMIEASSGLVNNIENAKNDVFKMELLEKIVKSLGIPLGELIPLIYTDLSTPNISVEDGKLNITFNVSPGIKAEVLESSLKDIVNSVLELSNDYVDKEKVLDTVAKYFVQEIEVIRNLKSFE
jgi:transcriptional regulator with XRE-family HTH domain